MIKAEGRSVAAMMNPRPLVLVTSADAEGKANVLTVAWTMSVSHQPPVIAISVAPQRYSHRLIVASGEFVVNIVGQEFVAAVRICGTKSGARVDKFAAAGLTQEPSKMVRAPRVAGALGYLECKLRQQIAVGDHTLFLGDVVCAEAREDAFADIWKIGVGDVLLCRQRDEYGRCVASATENDRV